MNYRIIETVNGVRLTKSEEGYFIDAYSLGERGGYSPIQATEKEMIAIADAIYAIVKTHMVSE